MLLLCDRIEREVVAILLKSAKIAGLRISVLCQRLCLTGYDSKRYSLHYGVLAVQSFLVICKTKWLSVRRATTICIKHDDLVSTNDIKGESHFICQPAVFCYNKIAFCKQCKSIELNRINLYF